MSQGGRLQVIRKSSKSARSARGKRESAQRAPGVAGPGKRGRRLLDCEVRELEKLGRCLTRLRPEERGQLLRFFLEMTRCVATIRGC